MSKPKADLPKWNDPHQGNMGGFLFPHCRAVVTIQEVAIALRISEQQVRDLADVGQLKWFAIGDKKETRNVHRRILRSSVEEYAFGKPETPSATQTK